MHPPRGQVGSCLDRTCHLKEPSCQRLLNNVWGNQTKQDSCSHTRRKDLPTTCSAILRATLTDGPKQSPARLFSRVLSQASQERPATVRPLGTRAGRPGWALPLIKLLPGNFLLFELKLVTRDAWKVYPKSWRQKPPFIPQTIQLLHPTLRPSSARSHTFPSFLNFWAKTHQERFPRDGEQGLLPSAGEEGLLRSQNSFGRLRSRSRA